MFKSRLIEKLDIEVFGAKHYSPYGVSRGKGLVERIKSLESYLQDFRKFSNELLQTRKQMKDNNHAMRHRMHQLEEENSRNKEAVLRAGQAIDLVANFVGVELGMQAPVEEHLVLRPAPRNTVAEAPAPPKKRVRKPRAKKAPEAPKAE